MKHVKMVIGWNWTRWIIIGFKTTTYSSLVEINIQTNIKNKFFENDINIHCYTRAIINRTNCYDIHVLRKRERRKTDANTTSSLSEITN